MTNSLLMLTGGMIGVLGLLAALFALQPLLVPFVLLAYLPVWLATVRNSRTSHRMGWRMTPSDRKRQYLGMTLTGKYFAQELRAFDLAGHLRRQYSALYDVRIDEVRHVTRTRLRRSLLASVASSVLSGMSVVVLLSLLLSRRMSVASVAAAAVAIQQLGGRLSAIAQSGSGLHEDALFLEDFNSFLELAPAVVSARPSAAAPEGFSTLDVEHLSFSYPGTRPPGPRRRVLRGGGRRGGRRWSARTGQARPPWPSSCATCTRRAMAGSCGTGSTPRAATRSMSAGKWL